MMKGMVNYGAKELAASFRTVRKNTIQIAEEAKPRTKPELLQWLRDSGEEFARWVETLPEDFLAQVFVFPAGAQPPSRTRFDMIMSVKEHEMHHRGQLMLIERLLGITPHLTRQMQERMAAMQQQAQPARSA